MRICGGDNVFCPAGTVAPINVHSGFYTVDYNDYILTIEEDTTSTNITTVNMDVNPQ